MSYYAVKVEKVGDRIKALTEQLSDTKTRREAISIPDYGSNNPGPGDRLKPLLAQWWRLISDISSPANDLPAWQARAKAAEELSRLGAEILELKREENTMNEATGLDRTIHFLESELTRAEGEYFDLTNKHFQPGGGAA